MSKTKFTDAEIARLAALGRANKARRQRDTRITGMANVALASGLVRPSPTGYERLEEWEFELLYGYPRPRTTTQPTGLADWERKLLDPLFAPETKPAPKPLGRSNFTVQSPGYELKPSRSCVTAEPVSTDPEPEEVSHPSNDFNDGSWTLGYAEVEQALHFRRDNAACRARTALDYDGLELDDTFGDFIGGYHVV